MANLTEDQVDKARDAWCKSLGTPFTCFDIPLAYRCFNAVAPYLQLPWDEISICEFGDISITKERIDSFDLINRFVRRRNAALLPKPVDPRRAKIQAILSKHVKDGADQTVDQILALFEPETAMQFGVTKPDPHTGCVPSFYESSVLSHNAGPRPPFKPNPADEVK